MIHFILGGARSGKSRFAEQQSLLRAKHTDKEAIYVATATAIDNEMAKRIAKHQADRSQQWQLIECPLALAEQVKQSKPSAVYLIDCLTLWLNNVLFSLEAQELSAKEKEAKLKRQIKQLISALANSTDDFFVVSNEVGLGIMPMGEITRLFVDHCGWLNQGLAEVADQVTLVTAGLPLTLKTQC